jgi:photosystem II stability/assembly factor-like uncharacterized protein
MKKLTTLTILFCLFLSVSAQKTTSKDSLNAKTFSGLKFRNIGPALTSGRISDVAIHPEDNNTWYVCAGSGGVWKTLNSGTTWTPIFDGQKVYSIGCVTIDPSNPHTVWVGTGENVGGRHVGYGDGIYRSKDDGQSWKNMGLNESQHISKIIVHPNNSNIIWVAAQGPLWSKGDERGLYKTTDGGKTWNRYLGDDEWTGVTDIVIDPRNPDVLYAATWQRHRTVASYMGGGPGSGIHKSTDGGLTWEKLKKGLPGSDMGKIGLAISPQKPDVIYAAIELDRRTGGVYKSENRGASWSKQSDAVSGGTGPHYYQELYASPHEFDKIYLVDVRIQVSEDGGKTFNRLSEKDKHSDNHAIAFRNDEPNYLLVGTDGGLYESYDDAKNWRFMANLPLTQYYKIALDDSEPFYKIYGGTQDNGTQGGPSRTPFRSGISNADWFMNLFADGHQPATEPGNPNIVYSETQEGNLYRVDRKTGEAVSIQPQPVAGENYERFNWDSPILVSPHNPATIYFASQRVWKSENRGDSWTPISNDLTLNQERLELPIMDSKLGWDSPWDMEAMSNYNTITSLSESPIKEGLIYAGTDDGSINITKDGGKNWETVKVDVLPGVPATAFVNDIKADLFDENTVYAVLDNHKYGDFKPYVFKSTNMGKSWKSITANLPDKTLIWRIVQDHVKPELLFTGTEFGIYTSIDGGNRWVKLSGGIPTISFRDIAIQKRENDLVGASFGRSFFVLDDYSALRDVDEETFKKEATLFNLRDALLYIPRASQTFWGKGSQGASYFIAPNPPFGAVFTYYLSENYTTKKSARKKAEAKLKKEKKDIPFPGWDELDAELKEEKPVVILTIKDGSGNVVRRIKAETGKGFHRIAWDLRYPNIRAINLQSKRVYDEYSSGSGFLVVPGTYYASLSKRINGVTTQLTDSVSFNVVQMQEGTLPGTPPAEILSFGKEVNELLMANSALNTILDNAKRKVAAMRKALLVVETQDDQLYNDIYKVKVDLDNVERKLYGSNAKKEIGEKNDPTISGRIWGAIGGLQNTTYGPTQTQRMNFDIAKVEFGEIKEVVVDIVDNKIPKLELLLMKTGAPWIEGQPIPE